MKVSVITVVFNDVEHIVGAIESVISQNYSCIEYIVVDGGSTDGTLEVINEYRDQISLIFSEPDRGIYDAMNKGISLSSGEVVGFLHADDFFSSCGVISSIVDHISSIGSDVVYGDLDYVSENNADHVVRHWQAGPFIKEKLRSGWMPPHPTVYAVRKVYEQLGGFDCSYRIAADYDFMLRILSKDELKIGYKPSVLVKMRTGGESNRNLSNIIRKSMEDYRALKSNQVGGIMALIYKNLRKLPQFFICGNANRNEII